MRKIILFIHSTFNGVVTGDPSKDKGNFMVWVDKSTIKPGSERLLQLMEPVDTILLGRGTYELLSKQWPPMSTSPLGKKINNAHKVVVTGDRPLDELRWGRFEAPTQIAGDDVEAQIKELKSSDGGDIVIFGSPVLVRSLTDANLIDEYHIRVHPVVVNYGQHLFDDLKNRKDFDLVGVTSLDNGSYLVTYKPAKK
jgi:dihydrofolate reductase